MMTLAEFARKYLTPEAVLHATQFCEPAVTQADIDEMSRELNRLAWERDAWKALAEARQR